MVIVTMMAIMMTVTGCKTKESNPPETVTPVITEVETTSTEKETTMTTEETTEETKPVEKTRETFYALNAGDILNVLEAESKLEELTIIVFDDAKSECYVLENGDVYAKKNTDRVFVYGIETFAYSCSIRLVERHKWNENYDCAEVFFIDFEGSIPITFQNVKDGKTITISLDKTEHKTAAVDTTSETKQVDSTGLSYAEWLDSTKITSPLINWDEDLGIGTFIVDGNKIYLDDIKQLIFCWGFGMYVGLDIVSTEILTSGGSFWKLDQELILNKSKITEETEVTINYHDGYDQTITFKIIP